MVSGGPAARRAASGGSGPRFRRGRVLALVVTTAAALAAAAAVEYSRLGAHARAMLHPPREPVRRPSGLPGVVDASFTARDGVTLRGWYVPSRTGAVVVLAHGWGAARGAMLPEARWLAAAGYGVLAFDWRAHGQSDGERSTWGLRERDDLEAAIAYVSARHDVDARRIGAVGFSLGGMVVADVAARDPRLAAIVVEAASPTLAAELRQDAGRAGAVGAWVAERTLREAGVPADRERPVDRLCAVAPRPVLIVAGSADVVAPVALERTLYDAACGPKQFVIIPGARHGFYADAGGAAYRTRLVAFFDGALGPGPGPAVTLTSAPPPRAP